MSDNAHTSFFFYIFLPTWRGTKNINKDYHSLINHYVINKYIVIFHIYCPHTIISEFTFSNYKIAILFQLQKCYVGACRKFYPQIGRTIKFSFIFTIKLSIKETLFSNSSATKRVREKKKKLNESNNSLINQLVTIMKFCKN